MFIALCRKTSLPWSNAAVRLLGRRETPAVLMMMGHVLLNSQLLLPRPMLRLQPVPPAWSTPRA